MEYLSLDDLYEMTYDELIDYILNVQYDYMTLERKLINEEKKYIDKINKDYEDNRKMVANLLSSVVKEMS